MSPIGASDGGNGGSSGSSSSHQSQINSMVLADPEKIRERETELEKIHRRSRELMLSPRGFQGGRLSLFLIPL